MAEGRFVLAKSTFLCYARRSTRLTRSHEHTSSATRSKTTSTETLAILNTTPLGGSFAPQKEHIPIKSIMTDVPEAVRRLCDNQNILKIANKESPYFTVL